jgi:hypothetical protein
MTRIQGMSLAVLLSLIAGRTASATDYWDASLTNDDNAINTYNEMYHGVSQQHDLEAHPGPVADEDWSFLMNAPYSSYEAILDSGSADIYDPLFHRINADGTTMAQASEAANFGASITTNRALRWRTLPAETFTLNFLRIRAACGTNCGSAAQYRIRFYETTIAVPRFNNAAGQVTVLLIQNNTAWTRPITGTVYYWNTAGSLLDFTGFSFDARRCRVINTALVAGAAGQGGTITIVHDGGYGGLAVKAVALEPATGFSFDTPGTYKPQ